MNNTKEELCKKILEYKEQLRDMNHLLFSDYKELFYNRILKVCEQTIRGHKEPISCSQDYSIEFGIVKNGLNGLQNNDYPSRSISLNVAEHFSNSKLLLFIEVDIEASWHDEIDGTIHVMFPVNDYDFDAYLERLKDSADKREIKAKKDMEEKIKTVEEKEKEQLKLLKEKYETGG